MKVLGYADLTGEGWASGSAYISDTIKKIQDPNAKDAITCSVPSPFARLERIKTAFENISGSNNLKTKQGIASVEDERIVSQTLDIAELVYQRAVIKELTFTHWTLQDAITTANTQNNTDNRQFIDTLALYLGQDTQFNPVVNGQRLAIRDFYPINYNHVTIGSTSPSTLFASADIDFSNIKLTLDGNRHLFTTNTPLYDRDPNFQKFLYYLYSSQRTLMDVARTLFDYLEQSLKYLQITNVALYNDILNIRQHQDNPSQAAPKQVSDFIETLTLPGLSSDNDAQNIQPISVAGLYIHAKRNLFSQQILNHSGFRILVNNDSIMNDGVGNVNNQRPLVLPPQDSLNDYANIPYVNGHWNKNITVPYFDSNPLDKRALPGLNNIRYPYLTVSDFLEPTLIELSYPISSDFYASGGNGKNGYLLPLKPKFFEFFTTDSLIQGSQDDQYLNTNQRAAKETQPEIQIIEEKNGVTVHLFIPIEQRGVRIRFTRHYLRGRDVSADEQKNQGNIVNINFALALYPKLKVNNGINFNHLYQVQAAINQTKNPSFDIRFFKSIETANLTGIQSVSRFKDDYAKSQQYTIRDTFDYIQLDDNLTKAKGILIPQWKHIDYQPHSGSFYFAVDFGTTNTHIEYAQDSAMPQVFDISSQDVQLATLIEQSFVEGDNATKNAIIIDLHNTTLKEFLPKYISTSDSSCSFPQRTVIAYNKIPSILSNMMVLNDTNIPFIYNKKALKGYNYQANLKWVNDNQGQTLTKLFIEQLLLLIRNKVLLNGGHLDNTNIMAFYPTSMTGNDLVSLENTWDNLFKQHISNNQQNLTLIPESLAPYYYYESNSHALGNTVSIDIGGGTTDVVLFSRDNRSISPKLLTSFRFAANNIFGDVSTSGGANRHPLLNKYMPEYRTNLSDNMILKNVLGEIFEKNISAEVNAFLFSIAQNEQYKNKSALHYENYLTKDNDYRIVFLYFYTAIIYHVAKWLKYYGQPVPDNFIFSGTGAKILSILDTPRFRLLQPYTNQILTSIFGAPNININIKFDANIAKAITCKGGVYRLQALEQAHNTNTSDSIQHLQKILVHDHFTEPVLTYDTFNNDAGLHNEIVQSVQDFNAFFYELLTKDYNHHAREFGIDGMVETFKDHCDQNLKIYLEDNITRLNNSANGNNPVTNAPFFYPIIGGIQNIMYAIDKKLYG